MHVKLNGRILQPHYFDGQAWYLGIEAIEALGFTDVHSSLSRIISRHFDVFVESGHARKYEFGKNLHWFISLTGLFLLLAHSSKRFNPALFSDLVDSITCPFDLAPTTSSSAVFPELPIS